LKRRLISVEERDPLKELFDSLIDDETERKIIRWIIEGRNPEEIVEKLLGIDGGKTND